MEIKRLNSDVISNIRSSFNINSVAQCVFELVCNSLDAKSTSIAVRINLITFKIQVADNGDGIAKESLELIGVRYMTNKCHTIGQLEKHLNTYGFRGEALASIVDMCKSVKISSRYKNSLETFNKILYKDSGSDFKLSKHRPSVGTTVTVLGFLNNYPVRQKRIIQELEIEEVKKSMGNLIIINPGTSFSLRNDVTGLLILNSPKNTDIIGSFRHLHPDITDCFTLLKVSKNKIALEALIHKDFISSKKFQYVYVNRKPILSQRILNSVNKSFYQKAQTRSKKSKNVLYKTKKYPVYVLNIKCPQTCVDVFMKSSKCEVEFTCWDLVLTCIEKITKAYFGGDDKKDINTVMERRQHSKITCGVSQVHGAVEAYAYKRKSDETLSDCDDNVGGNKDIADNKRQKLSKVEKEHKSTLTSKFIKDKTAVTTSQNQELSDNYKIEDSGRQKQFKKPKKLRSIIKKPLPIKITSKTYEQPSEITFKDVSEKGSAKKSVELQTTDLVPLCNVNQSKNQVFDQKSVYSGLDSDENHGKNLIMDMFLKSTQVFTGEDGASGVIMKKSANVSRETIEESNFVMENNFQDTVRGINTTMSINVNVKKKRLKDCKSKVSKCVQTSIVEEKLNQLTSKFVQTSQKPATKLERVRSNLSDLTYRFDGFKLSHDVDGVKDNYTILINTVHKRREFRFVRKSEDMEVDSEEEEFRPLKICKCGLDNGKIFKFDKAPVRAVEENISEKPSEQLMVKASDEKKLETEPDYSFPKPPAISKSKIPNGVENPLPENRIRKRSLNFRGLTRHGASKSSQNMNVCEKSPYFDRNKIFQRKSSEQVEKFESSYKNTKLNYHYDMGNVQKNVVSSPYFSRIPEQDNYTTNKNPKAPHQNFPLVQNDTSRILPACNPNQLLNQNIIHGINNLGHNYANPPHIIDMYQWPHIRGSLGIGNDFYRVPNNPYLPHLCYHENNLPPISGYQGINQHCWPSRVYERELELRNWNGMNDCNGICNMKGINPGNNFDYPEQRDFDGVQKASGPPQGRERCIINAGNVQNQEIVEDFHEFNKYKAAKSNVIPEAVYFGDNDSPETEDRSEENAGMQVEVSWTSPTENRQSNIETGPIFEFSHSQDFSENKKESPSVDRPKTDEKNQFNFMFSCTPDIFSTEIFNNSPKGPVKKDIIGQDAEKDTGSKNKNDPEAKDPGDINNFFDLPSFGVKDLDFNIANKSTNTICPSQDESKLEISLVDEAQKKKLIEEELLDAGHINESVFNCDSDLELEARKIGDVNNEKSRFFLDSQNEWIRKINERGKNFYFNKKTGMVSAVTPKIDQELFGFGKRLGFVPKGMSQVLQGHKKVDKTLSQNAKSKLQDFILESYDNELLSVKWQNFINDDPKLFFEEIYKEKSKQFENCIPSVQDNAVKNKMHKDLVGFNREMFQNLEMVGQLDKKFIVVLEASEKRVILFDQHAVDERIRVEKFLKEYKGLKAPCKIISLFMPRNDLSLLKKHSDYLSTLGLDVNFFTECINILKIPLCLQEKFNSEDNADDLTQVINILIKEIIEYLKETRGSISKLPKIIQDVINLKACRGAIKFGDFLTKEDCSELLKELAKCKLPFQCAHGRPTLTPLLTLDKVELKRKRKEPNLKKLLQ